MKDEYHDKYEEIQLIGQCYQDNSHLYLVKDLQNCQYLCAKKMLLTQESGNELQLLNEVSLLKNLNHPHVLRYHDICLENDQLISILEFCQEGDLYSYLQKKRHRKEVLSERLILCWLMQMLMALEYVHSKNILHRLIDSHNVYLNHQGDLKIGAFGHAKILENTLKKAMTVITEPCNMSPEMVEGKPYDSKADIWALGCILYELTTFQTMFKFGNLVELYDLIVQKPIPEIPIKYSKYIAPIFRKMLKKNPNSRPSATQLLQEEVFIVLMKQYIKKKRIDSLDLKYIVPKVLNIHRKKANEKEKRQRQKQKMHLKLPPLTNSQIKSNSLMLKTESTSSNLRSQTTTNKKSKNYSQNKSQGRQSSREKTNEEKKEISAINMSKKKASKQKIQKCNEQNENLMTNSENIVAEKAERITRANTQSGHIISTLCENKLQMIMKKYKPNMSQIYEQTFDFQDLIF